MANKSERKTKQKQRIAAKAAWLKRSWQKGKILYSPTWKFEERHA